MIRIIGDVHGHYAEYVKIATQSDTHYTLQLGDMGFSYRHFQKCGLSSAQHMFFGGNHDNYDLYNLCPNALGDYGMIKLPGEKPFFFVRGAYSIDKKYRTIGIDWWEREELTVEQGQKALELYSKVKPTLMITHDCPEVMREVFLSKNMGMMGGNKKIITRTGNLLQKMFEIHQPKLHIFGHWHQSIREKIDDCMFQCLNELEYIDI